MINIQWTKFERKSIVSLLFQRNYLKSTSFEKRNNLDELINIPIKSEEGSVIQIAFRTQDPNIRQAQAGTRVKITADPRSTVFSKSPHKSTIRALFKAKSLNPKAYSPPLYKVLEVSETLLTHVTTLYKPKKISCSRKVYLHLYLWRLQVVKVLKLPLESIIWIGYGTWALNGFNCISPV